MKNISLSGVHAGHEWVDLGIRVDGKQILFATCNIGAQKPEDPGDYFAWGETRRRYKSLFGNSLTDSSFEKENAPFYDGDNFTKYNKEDALITLREEDDIASIQWGAGWRMPTLRELEALLSKKVTTIWTSNYLNGIAGLIILGKGVFSKSSIFFPAVGDCYRSSRWFGAGANPKCKYWSSTRHQGEVDYAFRFYCNKINGKSLSGAERCSGSPVRPVIAVNG